VKVSYLVRFFVESFRGNCAKSPDIENELGSGYRGFLIGLGLKIRGLVVGFRFIDQTDAGGVLSV
jgi:hypothetical protein